MRDFAKFATAAVLLTCCPLAVAQQAGTVTPVQPAALIMPLEYKVPAAVPDVQAAQVPDRVQLEGMIGNRVRENALNRLLEVDIDRLLEGYRKRPGRQTWDGEHIGKWLHAATLAWVNTGNPALRAKLDSAVVELMKCQEDDGYLGTYLPARRWREWDVWAHKYNLIGLLTYMHYTGNTKPLETCVRMGDLLVREFGEGENGAAPKREILTAGQHVGMAPTSVLEPMVLLYRTTGDAKYKTFCDFIVRSWERPLGPHIVSRLLAGQGVNTVGNGKAYEMLSCINGMLEWYRVTGDPQFLKAAEAAWQDIVDKRLYLTGTASAQEHFRADYDLPNVSNVGETCVTVTWEQFNLQLLRLTGEARFSEQLEKTIYNQLCGAQRPDGKAWGYYVQMEGIKPFRDTFDANCCLSSGPRGFALVPTYAVTTDAEGIVVNLYDAAKAQLTAGGKKVRVNVSGSYPAAGAIAITVTPETAASFAVKLRLPAWCNAPSVALNGKPEGVKGADGYLKIARTWQPGEKILVTLPADLRVVTGDHSNAGKLAFEWGPLVLAYDTALNPLAKAYLPGPVADAKQWSIRPEQAMGAFKDWPGAEVFHLAAGSKELFLAPFATAGANGGRYRVWLAPGDASLPENLLAWGTESRSRQGNVTGSFLEGETVVTFDGRSALDDWYAVTLTDPITIKRVVFAHGRLFHDGGWFDSTQGKPRIQVKKVADGPGTGWMTVGELTDYPATTATNPVGLQDGQRFTLVLKEPLKVTAVRVIGKPASGDSTGQAFSSSAGLFAMPE